MGKHESKEISTNEDYRGTHRAEDNPGGWRGGPVGDQSGRRQGGGEAGENLGGR